MQKEKAVAEILCGMDVLSPFNKPIYQFILTEITHARHRHTTLTLCTKGHDSWAILLGLTTAFVSHSHYTQIMKHAQMSPVLLPETLLLLMPEFVLLL